MWGLHSGKVIFFDNRKGFGFIEMPGSPDIYVYFKEIQGEGKTLVKGQEVEFKVEQGPKGPRATQVIRMDDGPAEESLPQEESHSERVLDENLALALIDNVIRLVSITPDGQYKYIDAAQEFHNILYLGVSETISLRMAVEEFESLINNPKVRERDIQNFFERNPDFIINDEYKQAHGHVVLINSKSERLIPDFVLEPIDQTKLCDLLELKPPSARIVVLKKNRMRFSSAVLEACAQLRTYSRYFNDQNNRNAFEKSYAGLRAFKPKMFVIIGRQGNIDPITIRDIQTDLPNLILRSYDEVLARMKWKLDLLREGRVRGLSSKVYRHDTEKFNDWL